MKNIDNKPYWVTHTIHWLTKTDIWKRKHQHHKVFQTCRREERKGLTPRLGDGKKAWENVKVVSFSFGLIHTSLSLVMLWISMIFHILLFLFPTWIIRRGSIKEFFFLIKSIKKYWHGEAIINYFANNILLKNKIFARNIVSAIFF
jgi:hypothetical protein